MNYYELATINLIYVLLKKEKHKTVLLYLEISL